MRFTTINRAAELAMEAVEVEFVVEDGKYIKAVIVRDTSSGAEFHIKAASSFSDNVIVLRRDPDEERATRHRLSGSLAPGVGILEYFESLTAATSREREIRDTAPGATLDVVQVEVYIDDHGDVLAEIADPF